MTDKLGFYDGSYILEPYAKSAGIPIDQLNFLACQIGALLVGFPFRLLLPADKTGPFVRHVIQLVLGISMAYFCFGQQIIHLFIQTALCYGLMLTLPSGLMSKSVFVTSLGYLCLGHIYRIMYDYGGYTLDITGPLMLNTQRLSSLAYSLRDGRVKDSSKLSDNMKQHAVKKNPSVVELLSYVFSFNNLMCGPFCFYKDYLAFIDGSQYETHMVASNGVNNNNEHSKSKPSPLVPVLKNLLLAVISVAVTFTALPLWPASHIEESSFLEKNTFSKMFYIIMATTMARFKYYFAWKLGQAINSNCGLGFNGYDSNGRAKWDLLDIVNIVQVEGCLSLKVLLDNWNITTTLWLRHVVYERTHNTWAVFAVSAFWHGFYPGYYITFASGALCIQAGRMVRRNIRPYFQRSKSMALFYDIITCLFTRLTLAYITFPFVILNFWPSIAVFQSMGYWHHLMVIGTILTFTFIVPSSKPKRTDKAA